ncbi:GW domain-containing glycosaminoglycan-binding protein [Listeria rocourtiae]|uniref:glucosaminidase domain-containing protein n=1 Tax=Listeria rocourtiae TaxID=647910 RepID=UPI00162883E7|nr:glucosaminidase domain-containing protein [Listeria rocourtiae]MBC1436140.1 GW domain-containing glycosaminoglycan-binding protein [Listeria rocourtiae]
MKKSVKRNVAILGTIGMMMGTIGIPVSTYAAERENNSSISYTNSQQEFLNKIVPDAQKLQREHGVLTSVTIAQAILESGWGKSGLTQQANNLFGIKGSYEGESITMNTKEFFNNSWTTIDAPFREYPSYYESLEDHALLFVNGPSWNPNKYAGLVGEEDYKKVAQIIEDGGYATDPNYAEQLIATVETYGLAKYDRVYDTIVAKTSLYAYGQVKPSAQAAAWSVPETMKNAAERVSLTNYKNKSLRLVNRAKVSDGSTWYEATFNGQKIGWINAANLNLLYTTAMEQEVNLIRGVENEAGKIYAFPVVDSSTVRGTLAGIDEVHVDSQAVVNNKIWYRINDGGKRLGWVESPTLK